MKKLFISFLMAATLSSYAFAADVNNVSYSAKHTFNTQFAGVTDVQWTVKESYTKASFQWLGENTEAFFDAAGQLIGTSKKMTLDQLALNTRKNLAKRLAGYSVTEVVEFTANDKTSFFVAADNADESVILKVSEGIISLHKKTRK